MKLIATQTLTSSQPSITFNAIPQNFADLYVLVSARGDSAGRLEWMELTFNSNTSNYSYRLLQGNGAAAASYSGTVRYAGDINASTSTANTFSNNSVYIPNYASAVNKSYSVDSLEANSGANANQNIVAGLWANTAAITSLSIAIRSGNLVAGSTVSLYGIGGPGSIAAKAVGGSVARVGDYWVHTFTSSGIFSPLENLTNVEYLVVAGGGGSGPFYSGGGGAGGYRCSVVGENSGGGASAETRLSFTAGTSHTVVVGAGGAGSNTQAEGGLPGSNSTFASITSIGGGKALGNGSTNAGGSGGGGGPSSFSNPELRIGGNGTANQGFNGGTNTATNSATGGGGGAGSAGGVPSGSTGGNGGNGVISSITGTAVARAGGGGGGGDPGPGGTATAGGGAGSSNVQASSGTANTGGGAGGRYDPAPLGQRFGQNGGSGIVVVRYLA